VRQKLVVLLVLMTFVMLTAFQFGTDQAASAARDTIVFRRPANFPKPLYAVNITDDGFALGKALFYDPALSANGTVSCGNCHQASAAFANLNSALSSGINNCKGSRNAPPLFNLLWQKSYMWDGRLAEMGTVPVNALTNPCEMGTSLDTVLQKLNQLPVYSQLFYNAYGSKVISIEKVLDALTQFTSMLVSADTKYDHVMRKEQHAVFSEKEAAGYNLFKEKCSSCHTEPLFTDQSFRNNGLEIQYADIGRDSLTHRNSDRAKFRVPSLRNVEITGPYMHDGRFYSLKEVLAHYATGVQPHANLDKAFKSGSKLGIPMTAEEQGQIIAFLKTLTDVNLINDRRFNNH